MAVVNESALLWEMDWMRGSTPYQAEVNSSSRREGTEACRSLVQGSRPFKLIFFRDRFQEIDE